MTRRFFFNIFFATILLALCGAGACAQLRGTGAGSPPKREITGIVSPYANVDWSRHGRYKAQLHAHTSNSDGKRSLTKTVTDYYARGYDILAITDHHFVTRDWVDVKNGIDGSTAAGIAAGADRKGRGMLAIPFTSEQSLHNHVGSYFVNWYGKNTLEETLATIESMGGLSILNHPGTYTGGKAGGDAGAKASNKPANIAKYVKLFMDHPSCVGMEIINKQDRDSASDRILWDNVLEKTVPRGRYAWCFAGDDSHVKADIDFSWNVFIMPANDLEHFKAAMRSGNFYAVAKVAKRELGASFKAAGPAPTIEEIMVDGATITLRVSHATAVEWISNGAVIATGASIDLNACQGVASYVRANIKGPGGIAFTQPFGIVAR